MRNKSFNGKIEEVFLGTVYIISTAFLALIMFNLFRYFDHHAVYGVFVILFGMAFLILSNIVFLFTIDLIDHIHLKCRNAINDKEEN